MQIGYDQPLYILPFDHRASLMESMFDAGEPLDDAQTATMSDAKQLIFEGLMLAVTDGIPRESAGVLVDEQFGADILRQGRREQLVTALPVEASGRPEFDFEYGDDFAAHIEAFDPTFAKALVRFNPAGDAAQHARELPRLKLLSEVVHAAGRRLMIELLVPPEPGQLAEVGGDEHAYARHLRPALMIESIAAFRDAGVDPDVWKLEGLDREVDARRIVEVARREGRPHVGCIVLGHGSDEATVRSWLRLAATVPGFTGFAVGRTTWWQPLLDFRAGQTTRLEAAQRIARDYEEWVDVFERASALGARAR
ncbi:MAG: DUF2090 domain-containing protein [Dehalococcoidia bacterium]